MATSASRQLAALAGIVGFTAAFGVLTYGIRAVGGDSYVAPACVQACKARGAEHTGIDYRMGKNDHQSLCLCTGNVRIASPEADTVATASIAVPLVWTVALTGAILAWLSRRAKRA